MLLREYEVKESSCPEGNLNCKKVRGKPEYYQRKEDGTQKHIHPKNKNLIIALRTKGFIVKSMKILRRNLRLQEKLLKVYEMYDLHHIEPRLPGAYSETNLVEWMNRYYNVNPFHQEHKIYQTSFGLLVRSKSEVLIAELLHAARIPFHYDEEILLKDANGEIHRYYVDFVIMTPSGKKLYWEHMGLFYKEDYRIKNYDKIKVFFDNEIILSENLIITMDSPAGGINAQTIDRVIKGQILPHFN